MQSFIVTPGRFMHSVLRRQSRSDSAMSLQLRPCEGAECESCTGRRERDHTRTQRRQRLRFGGAPLGWQTPSPVFPMIVVTPLRVL